MYLTSKASGPMPYVLGLAAAIVGLLAKESATVLFGLLPMLALTIPQDERARTWRECALAFLPFGLLTAFVLMPMLHPSTRAGGGYDLGPHIWQNLREYLEWAIFPYERSSHDAGRSIGAAAFLALALLSIVLRERVAVFLAVWTLFVLLPYSGFEHGIELRYTYLAVLPLTAFVCATAVALVRRLPGPLVWPIGAAIVAVAVAALVVMPQLTRDRQAGISLDAARYQEMIESAREQCGPLAPLSSIFVVRAPYWDLFRMQTRSALNLYYDRVHAANVDELPELIDFVENKCIIQYVPETGDYVRVER
jgi:hypothetical protein